MFMQALGSYKTHEHEQLAIGGDDLASMVLRFRKSIPVSVLLEAITEILKQAKESKQSGSYDLSSPAGTASMNSVYEFRLFELLPVIREIDAEQATSLLREEQNLRGLMTKYPEGIQSLDNTIRESPLGKDETSSLSTTVRMNKSDPERSEDVIGKNLELTLNTLVKNAKSDPGSIAKAASLPIVVGDHDIRADSLEAIAAILVKDDIQKAREALDIARNSLTNLPTFRRAQHLGHIAQLYLEIHEKESASATIDMGLKAAEELEKQDLNADDPNKGPKAFWPSTHVFRLFIHLSDNISHRLALEKLNKVDDPEMVLLLRLFLADSWMDIRPKFNDVIEKRKAGETYKQVTSTVGEISIRSAS
jgi:hypothetical protein